MKCDIRALPVESDSADAVAAIHVIEHFYAWEVQDVLMEWKRILKPGGTMILELPCLDKIFDYIAKMIQHRQPVMRFMTTHALYGDPGHQSVPMLHKWAYTAADMKAALEDVGMRDVTMCDPNYHFKFRDMRFEAVK